MQTLYPDLAKVIAIPFPIPFHLQLAFGFHSVLFFLLFCIFYSLHIASKHELKFFIDCIAEYVDRV